MLLEFKTKNYKSFCDEMLFSMRPAPKQKGMDYSVLKQKIGGKIHSALCSAVFYGANASGKTNIIGAMDTFRSIVLRGNIRNGEEQNSSNAAAHSLELIPNKSSNDSFPVEFSVAFIEGGVMVEYSFAMEIGRFLEISYKRRITLEQLKINGNLIFCRTNELILDSLKAIKGYLVNNFERNKESVLSIARSNLNDDELFLMNGFKSMFSAKLVSLISAWLDSKFMVIYRADSIQLIRKFADPLKKSMYITKTLDAAAAFFGVTSNKLGYAYADNEPEFRLFSIFPEYDEDEKAVVVPADVFESYGTIRFINLFPLVMYALANGATLVVDEFDASIHPMALMSIINIFHNDEINVNKAQLIFNTHNPVFLNANLFRRDELKFTERDEATGHSAHYSLSDFKTTGEKGVRNGADYMRNYFINQYGAIKDIDFTPVFEDIIRNQKER